MALPDLGLQSKDQFLIVPDEQEELLELPSGHDLEVLEALEGSFDNAGAISFQGIRRKLGLHQETLSRVLRRLERDGLVEKLKHDYVISKKGSQILGKRNIKTSQTNREIVFPIPILRTILPTDASELELEEALSHKWFGSLRWFGSSHKEEGTVLSWTTEDGKLRLSARISNGYFAVESQATTKESLETAIRAAYEIFDHVSKVFKHRSLLPLSDPESRTYRAA
jgi:DNA-binding Lrp family transcriptional regulator